MKEENKFFMMEAILEGRKALPKCLPNPPVGCVIVKDGIIISRGHTNEPGKDHAEPMALKSIPGNIANFKMYVTLEPCSFQGKTPSCARTIVEHNVEKVYVGLLDPHPGNNGSGIEILKQSNIEVQVGLLKEKIYQELAPYLADR